MQMGYAPQEWKGRPVIAILNTWSDAQPCHMHFKSRVDDVRRGILMAGGFPMELPALSLSEIVPEADHHALPQSAGDGRRGAVARATPVDGVVLMGGCDKTTPALLLGATSIEFARDLSPRRADAARQLERQTLGSGSTPGNTVDERSAGRISDKDWGRCRGPVSPAATAPA